MPTSRFGVQLWPGSSEDLPYNTVLLRALHQSSANGLQADGWLALDANVNALGQGELCVNDRDVVAALTATMGGFTLTQAQLMIALLLESAPPNLSAADLLRLIVTRLTETNAPNLSASDLLRLLLTELSTLPASGSAIVQLGDENLVLPANTVTYTSWYNMGAYHTVGGYITNTGANPTDVAVFPMASGLAGAGLIAQGTGSALVLNAGSVYTWDFLSGGTVPTTATQNACKSPPMCRSIRVGIRSPLGTNLRCITFGRKAWARD